METNLKEITILQSELDSIKALLKKMPWQAEQNAKIIEGIISEVEDRNKTLTSREII